MLDTWGQPLSDDHCIPDLEKYIEELQLIRDVAAEIDDFFKYGFLQEYVNPQ